MFIIVVLDTTDRPCLATCLPQVVLVFIGPMLLEGDCRGAW